MALYLQAHTFASFLWFYFVLSLFTFYFFHILSVLVWLKWFFPIIFLLCSTQCSMFMFIEWIVGGANQIRGLVSFLLFTEQRPSMHGTMPRSFSISKKKKRILFILSLSCANIACWLWVAVWNLLFLLLPSPYRRYLQQMQQPLTEWKIIRNLWF